MGAAVPEYASLALKLCEHSPFLKYVFCKPHTDREEGVDSDTALFVAGLPWGFSEDDVRAVFGVFGDIVHLALHESKTSALVLFAKHSAQAATLDAARTGRVIEYTPKEEAGPIGLKRWVEDSKAEYPGNQALSDRIDDWMEKYEKDQERLKREREMAAAGDGWTVVVRRKGRKRASEGGTVVSGGISKTNAEIVGANKRNLAKEDFYRFQRREKRRSELVELREGFDAARKRMQERRRAKLAADAAP